MRVPAFLDRRLPDVPDRYLPRLRVPRFVPEVEQSVPPAAPSADTQGRAARSLVSVAAPVTTATGAAFLSVDELLTIADEHDRRPARAPRARVAVLSLPTCRAERRSWLRKVA